MPSKRAFKEVFGRPFTATGMLWRHRRTLGYLAGSRSWKQLYNYIFTTYFIRGEDCGKGVLDFVWKLFPKLTPAVWDLELEITTRCYLRCIHCEHSQFTKDYLNQDLSLQDFCDIVDSLPRLHWLNLTGEGSSFLNKNFMSMLWYAKRRGLYVDFSHDFFRLTEEQMRMLIELKIERIYVSIDGATKDVYEHVRVGSDFEQVTANIRRFVELKREMNSPLPELAFRYSFMKGNVEDVANLPDLIDSFGPAKDIGDEVAVNIVGLLEFPETKHLVTEIHEDWVDIVNGRAKELGQTVYWSHPTHSEADKPPMDYCTFWSEPYVMIGGYLLPCCAILMSNRRDFLERFAFGQVSGPIKQSVKELWNSDYFKKFRKTVVDPNAPVPILCYGCRTFRTADRAELHGVMGQYSVMTAKEAREDPVAADIRLAAIDESYRYHETKGGEK